MAYLIKKGGLFFIISMLFLAGCTSQAIIPPNSNIPDSILDEKVSNLGYSKESGGSSSVVNKDYANFYLNTGGVTGVSNSETTLIINTAGETSNSSLFTLSSNQVTVNKDGIFLITGDVSFNSQGSSRSEYNVWLEKNSVDVPGSRTANYQRGYDSGSTSTFTTIVSVTSGDVFQLRTQRTDGGGSTGYQDNQGTRISFVEI